MITEYKIFENAEEFKVGDEVIVDGIIDTRTFNNTPAIIVHINGSYFNIKPLVKTDDAWGLDPWNVSKRYIRKKEKENIVRTRWWKDGKLTEKSGYPIEETYNLIDVVDPFWTEDYDLDLYTLNYQLKKIFKNKLCYFKYEFGYTFHSPSGFTEEIVRKAYGDYDFDPTFLKIIFKTDHSTYRVDPEHDVKVYLKEPRPVITKNLDIDPYSEENWDLDESLELDEEWIVPPSGYMFSNGERVKMNPKSQYAHQAKGDKIGTILKLNSDGGIIGISPSWDIQWDEGIIGCHYWRNDLLIRNPNIGRTRWWKGGKLEQDLNEETEYREYIKTKEFIPFTIRENLDFNFEINQDYKKIRLFKNVDYLRVIKKLVVDKRITFYAFNYLTGKSSLMTFKVKNVSFNNYGILMFTSYQLEGSTDIFAVDERKEIIVEEIKKINVLEKYNEIDPYGEEEWGDEDYDSVFWYVKISTLPDYINICIDLKNILEKKYKINFSIYDMPFVKMYQENNLSLNQIIYLRFCSNKNPHDNYFGFMPEITGKNYFENKGYEYLGNLEEWVNKNE